MKKTDKQGRGKTALVTGASSGIGYELSKLLGADGFNVVLVARSRDKLIQVAEELKREYGVKAVVIAKDLSRVEAAAEVYGEVKDLDLQIDVLINNAGFGGYGFFTETDLQSELDMIQLNVTSLVQLSKLFIRDMSKRGFGRVLNVSSTASFQPGPLMAIYFATKAFVTSFSQAIGNELKGSGVTVTALCPGPTATNFSSGADMGDSLMFKSVLMAAEKVAKQGYEAMMKGRALAVTGLLNKLTVFLNRLFPRSWVVASVRSIQGK